MPTPTSKFKVGDIVKLLPYTGDRDTIENINLSSTGYNTVRKSSKPLVIRDVRYDKHSVYGTVYKIDLWVFHESRIVLVKKVIRY